MRTYLSGRQEIKTFANLVHQKSNCQLGNPFFNCYEHILEEYSIRERKGNRHYIISIKDRSRYDEKIWKKSYEFFEPFTTEMFYLFQKGEEDGHEINSQKRKSFCMRMESFNVFRCINLGIVYFVSGILQSLLNYIFFYVKLARHYFSVQARVIQEVKEIETISQRDFFLTDEICKKSGIKKVTHGAQNQNKSVRHTTG